METHPRRENGITVRYLSQTIINDSVFRDYSGVNEFVNFLENFHKVSKESFSNLKHYFFLHLEDYKVDDKSEIDFILWNEDVILPVEVKAFTDANSPDVKKEIIRNYLHIEEMKKKSKFKFCDKQKIFPVLLYSESYQNWKLSSNGSKVYFNEKYLLTKGKNQSQQLDNWGRGNYPIPEKYHKELNDGKKLEIINRNLFFIKWEDILKIHIKLNYDLFKRKIKELKDLKDFEQDKNIIGIPLIANGFFPTTC